jgi:hypothetical protein
MTLTDVGVFVMFPTSIVGDTRALRYRRGNASGVSRAA